MTLSSTSCCLSLKVFHPPCEVFQISRPILSSHQPHLMPKCHCTTSTQHIHQLPPSVYTTSQQQEYQLEHLADLQAPPLPSQLFDAKFRLIILCALVSQALINFFPKFFHCQEGLLASCPFPVANEVTWYPHLN